ncbi:MAG: amino acid racemase, partial [Pseudomonadota bacterium]
MKIKKYLIAGLALLSTGLGFQSNRVSPVKLRTYLDKYKAALPVTKLYKAVLPRTKLYMHPIIFGVIGNMGPEADTLFQIILRIKTGALKDQDHVRMVVVKNTEIFDRSAYILGFGEDPTDEILASIRILEGAGVTFAVMPCNTAHYFREALQEQTDIVILDMLKATVDSIKQKSSQAVVGLLSTTGAYNSKIYDKYLEEAGIPYFKPNEIDQENFVHAAVYGKKIGNESERG